MNIKIDSNFKFSIASIQYSQSGELYLSLVCDGNPDDNHYVYSANLGEGHAEEKRSVGLLEYAKSYASSSNIKPKTKDSYRLMCRHLEDYGNCPIEKVSTAYLQGFLSHLQTVGLKTGTVRLYFQKLACVLHDAYKNELFDVRILQRVSYPKRDQEKKCFLTELELKKLISHPLMEEYNNIQSMFMFSCLTGLRFGDVKKLKWSDVKRNGKHLRLEFHQQKTDTQERLPLCEDAERLLGQQKRTGKYVFQNESNQRVNTVLKRWCKKAKVKKDVSFHCARHTFCVLLLTKEVPIYTVQQLMCHSDIGTTKVYADLLNKTKAKAVRKMPSILC